MARSHRVTNDNFDLNILSTNQMNEFDQIAEIRFDGDNPRGSLRVITDSERNASKGNIAIEGLMNLFDPRE
jgi:hypothetical protein